MSDAATDFMDPAKYLYADWGMASGISPKSTAPVPIKVKTVWLYKSSDGELTKTYDGTVLNAPAYSAVAPTYGSPIGGCTLTNGVKEVFYDVEYDNVVSQG